MRLSTSMIYQQNLSSITTAYSKWQTTAVQLASGMRVNSPADDPIASSQAIGLENTQAIGTQYTAARSNATASLSLETTVVSQVTDVIHAIQTKLVQAGDGTLSDNDRQSLSTTLQSYKDQLLSLANSKDGNGNYVFAGYKTNSAPFVADATTGAVSYVGGTQAISQKVDDSSVMNIGDTGAQVFNHLTAGYTVEPDGTASETNVFNSIDTALSALNTPQENADSTTTAAYTASLAKATRGMSNSLDNMLTVQSSVGSKLNQLDSLNSVGTDRSTIYATRISDLTGADWYSTVSNYSLQQVALQAAYSTFNSMQKLSLFQINS